MKGRYIFTRQENREIKKLLSVLRDSKREVQKKIRKILREKCYFYISDFTLSNIGFTVNDYNHLKNSGRISVI